MSKHGPSVRLHPDLMVRLRAAADDRDVSIAWLANRLITEGLDAMGDRPLRLTAEDQ